jgi:hypothetical protein
LGSPNPSHWDRAALEVITALTQSIEEREPATPQSFWLALARFWGERGQRRAHATELIGRGDVLRSIVETGNQATSIVLELGSARRRVDGGGHRSTLTLHPLVDGDVVEPAFAEELQPCALDLQRHMDPPLLPGTEL